MKFEVGDKVRYGDGLWSGVNRQGHVGEVVRAFSIGATGERVDIRFSDGTLDLGISVGQLVKVN